MIGWKPEEDDKLRQAYGKTGTEEIEKMFGRKKQAIWLRAKKLGIVQGKSPKRHWSVKEAELLFALTKRMADPKEIANAFPGVPMDEILREAERIECDICYLKNREVIRRSVDVIIDLDMTLNFKNVRVS